MLLGFCLAGIVTLLFAAMVYPGELSQFGPLANRWLYNRAAQTYQDKWQSPTYQCQDHRDKIIEHVMAGIATSGINSVLDLGCGTGRGVRLTIGALDTETHYTGVDFSAEMLARFRAWLATQGQDIAARVHLLESEVGQWATTGDDAQYGAVFLLEVGEFLPDFIRVIEQLANRVAPGGALVMTRPAHFWWLFFPGRRQSRRALAQLLESAGFERPRYIPWRFRYEILLSRRRLQQVPPP